MDTTNPIAPVQTTTSLVNKLIYHGQFDGVINIQYPMPAAENMYGDDLRELESLATKFKETSERPYGVPASSKNSVTVTPMLPIGEKKDSKISSDALNIQRHYMGSKGGSSFDGDILGAQTSVVSHREVKRRIRGDPVIIQR